LAVAAVLGLAASTASAAVLTFDDYSQVDQEQASITYGGFTFAKTVGDGYQYVWDASSPNSKASAIRSGSRSVHWECT